MSRPKARRRRRAVDPARLVAYRVLRAVSADGAYANLELASRRNELSPIGAGFATELVAGTCRAMGSYDQVIARAAGRALNTMQPAVVDVLRLGSHQLLAMRVPDHAALATSVDLAAKEIGERVSGLVNAVLRRVSERTWPEWFELLAADTDELGRLGLEHHHPRWILEAWSKVLPEAELGPALAADNIAPVPNLVVRPGLAEVAELGGTPARFSPFGAYREGDPSQVRAVAEGRAGVQDEGSQLVSLALARASGAQGPWLDLCAGPGGKAALLAGLAQQSGQRVVAAELQPHRARLVAQNLAAFSGPHRPVVLVADGTRPPWAAASFGKVLADVPCTGLGALRRRPESRWRRRAEDLPGLVELQQTLLESAIRATRPGGVIGYVTCSPHPGETAGVVERARGVSLLPAADFLPEVPLSAQGDFVQLWPHRHGTDAMFLALLRRD